MKKKYKQAALAAVVVVCLVLWLKSALTPVPVEAECVQPGSLERRFTVQAELLPKRSMILAAPVSGKVTELLHRSGEEVAAGTVLLRTDTSREISMDLQREQLLQQLNAARREYDRLYGENGAAASELVRAESHYRLAKKTYDRTKALADSGDLPQAELDAVKSELDAAYEQYAQAKEDASEEQQAYYREQIASCERQLEAASQSVSPGTQLMPYDGVVWETYVEEGAYLTQNQPVMKIYPSGEMKLSASALEEDAALLSPGMEAEAVYPSGERSRAVVTFVSRTAKKEISSTGIEESRRLVELTADAMPKQAGAGQQADVTFAVLKAEEALTVPASAVAPKGSDSIVYVISGGKARERKVETGVMEGGRVEALTGLTAGDVVAADPYEAGIRDGSRVEPVILRPQTPVSAP